MLDTPGPSWQAGLVSRVPFSFAWRHVRHVAPLIVLAAAAAWPASAQAQDPELPGCEGATAPALRFAGLPSRVPFGRAERFGVEDSYRTSSTAVGGITVEMVGGDGDVFFEGLLRGRGSRLLWIQLDLEDPPARVYATFVEEAPDLSRCVREISRLVRGKPWAVGSEAMWRALAALALTTTTSSATGSSTRSSTAGHRARGTAFAGEARSIAASGANGAGLVRPDARAGRPISPPLRSWDGGSPPGASAGESSPDGASTSDSATERSTYDTCNRPR